MKRVKVISSTLISIGYSNRLATLELEFTTSAVYQYYNVPVSVYLKLMEAPSKGTFFNEFIKDQYDFSKISD